jgi:hypothetical protein
MPGTTRGLAWAGILLEGHALSDSIANQDPDQRLRAALLVTRLEVQHGMTARV